MSLGNYPYRNRLTEVDRNSTLRGTENRRMYDSISRAGSGFASLCLLREAGAHADESLSLLP